MKIYNGYKLPQMNLMEWNQFVLDFQKMAEKHNEERLIKLVTTRFIDVLQDAIFMSSEHFKRLYLNNEETRNARIFRQIYQTIKQEYFEMKETMEWNNEVDFDIALSVFPLEDKVLLLLYSEDSELLDIFESMPQVSYYGYWNNTDPDENCSEAEWEQRKTDWEIALPGLGIPKETGMTIQIADGLPSFSSLRKIKLSTYSSVVEERIRANAKAAVLDQVFASLKRESPEKENMGIFREANKLVDLPHHQAKIKEVMTSWNIPLLQLEDAMFLWTFTKLYEVVKEKNNKDN